MKGKTVLPSEFKKAEHLMSYLAYAILLSGYQHQDFKQSATLIIPS